MAQHRARLSLNTRIIVFGTEIPNAREPLGNRDVNSHRVRRSVDRSITHLKSSFVREKSSPNTNNRLNNVDGDDILPYARVCVCVKNTLVPNYNTHARVARIHEYNIMRSDNNAAA